MFFYGKTCVCRLICIILHPVITPEAQKSNNMNKLLKRIFSLLCVVGLTGIVSAQSVSCDFWDWQVHGSVAAITDTLYCRVLDENTAQIVQVGSQLLDSVLNIPETVTNHDTGKTYKVTVLGENSVSLMNSYPEYLKEVRIPKTVTEVAFQRMTLSKLEFCTVDEASESFSSLDGVLFTKDFSSLMIYPPYRSGVYTVPETVIAINDYAFQWCSKLTQVKMPEGVSRIGYMAFSYSGLTFVDMPNSVSEISGSAYRDCNALKTVKMGKYVNSIGNEAFQNCSTLSAVYCATMNPPSLGEDVFSGCANPDTLFVPYEVVDTYKEITKYKRAFDGRIFSFSDVGTVTTNSASLMWVADSTVTLYTVSIFTGGELFATYYVDGKGQIIPEAPLPQQRMLMYADTTVNSTEYFVITLSDLSENTVYTYTIVGTDIHETPVYYEQGQFETKKTMGLPAEEAVVPRPARKRIREGQVLIEKDGKVYTPQGIELF